MCLLTKQRWPKIAWKPITTYKVVCSCGNFYKKVEAICDELQLAYDFFKEEAVTEEEVDNAYSESIRMVEDLELMNMLRKEEDKLGAVVKIVAGAGGTEAQDWGSMLMRMYLRWCEAKGYKTEIAHILDGDEAGIKSVTIKVEGDFAEVIVKDCAFRQRQPFDVVLHGEFYRKLF